MLEGLFPSDVEIEWGDPGNASKALFPEEEALVARAVPKRQREFAKGRECARVALERLGLRSVLILSGKDREPLWPVGLVGSITHTAGFCAAAVARSERYAGLGIDAEPAEALEPDVVERVCHGDEARLPAGVAAVEEAIVPRVVFCAKEALYKCQFPVTRAFLGFEDVSVELGEEVFRVRLRVGAPPYEAGASFEGRWRKVGAHIVTAVWAERR